jgi:hypothetical protein
MRCSTISPWDLLAPELAKNLAFPVTRTSIFPSGKPFTIALAP